MNTPKFLKTKFTSNRTESSKRPFYRQTRLWLLLLAILIVLVLIKQVQQHAANKTKAPTQPVVVATAHSADVPVYLSGLGTVTPTYTVTVKTQINGQLLQVLFTEGQMVKAGDLLAQIDPRPYQAQLIQYQGQLERDVALLANAKLDLARYKTLWSQDSVSKQIYDTQASLVKQNEGTVAIDKGLIISTKLNLLYTRITSPVNGRVGLRLVDPGNYVQVSDTTGLAIIDTINPITVIFTLPEDTIQQVLPQVMEGVHLSVKAFDRTQTHILAQGSLLTIDNQVDPTTGTVRLKAEFLNDKGLLFPNQFVNVQLLVRTLHDAILVPTAAIQLGADGPYAYIVNKDKTVTRKAVNVDITIEDETTVTAGIAPGDIVVIEGADKLTNGSKVSLPEKTDPSTTPSRRKVA